MPGVEEHEFGGRGPVLDAVTMTEAQQAMEHLEKHFLAREKEKLFHFVVSSRLECVALEALRLLILSCDESFKEQDGLFTMLGGIGREVAHGERQQLIALHSQEMRLCQLRVACNRAYYNS